MDTTPIAFPCEACGALVRGTGADGYVEASVAHVRAEHADWRYPDAAVRRYAAERLERERWPPDSPDRAG